MLARPSPPDPEPAVDRGPSIVALMGSYHRYGALDHALEEVLAGAREAGARTEKLVLLDQRIEFCMNCRACMAEPGAERGRCVIEDDLESVLRALEQADGIVLGSPVNHGDVNALTRRLLERMGGYAYWPDGAPAPRARDPRRDRPAVLVTTSAAPALLTRTLMRPLETLKRMASLVHARPVGSLVVGLAGGQEAETRPGPARRARALGRKLAARAARAAAKQRSPTPSAPSRQP